MDSAQKDDLLKYFTSIASSKNLKTISYNQVFFETIKNNLPVLAAIWFLGLTMIGIPATLIIDVLKGYTIGFTVSFFVNSMGIKGIWFSLLSVMPQNIIYIPCIIIASVISLRFSMMLVKDNEKKQLVSNLPSKLFSYSTAFFVLCFFMFLGFSFETYVTPNIIKMIA
jgi:stage II sporulation protein M